MTDISHAMIVGYGGSATAALRSAGADKSCCRALVLPAITDGANLRLGGYAAVGLERGVCGATRA